MQLFESINRPPLQQPISLSPPSQKPNEERFTTTMAEYSSSPSFIDSVVALVEDALSVGRATVGLV